MDQREFRSGRTNWRVPPHSRSTFHRIDEIVPTVPILRDPAFTRTLLPAPVPMDGFRISTQSYEFLDLAAFHDATATDAMVVLYGGRIAYEYYANGNAAHRPHIVMSMTKSIIGLVSSILGERGRLNADAPVAQFFEAAIGTPYENARIRDLLDMRMAVDLDARQQREYALATNWEPLERDEPRLGLRTFFTDLRGAPAPRGGAFKYRSSNTDLLGLAIERATGEPLAVSLGELLWKPLGTQDDAYITVDVAGVPRAAGGLCATALDLARVGHSLVEAGRRDARSCISHAVLEDITENGDYDSWLAGEWAEAFGSISRKMRYRSGWYVVDDEPRAIFAMGSHGQSLYVDIENAMVVVKFSSAAERIDHRAIGLTHLAVAEFRRILVACNG